MTAQNIIQQAADLAKAGQVSEARRLLAGDLCEHPDNFEAWLALAGMVDDRERARYYIERALELSPDDPRVLRYIKKLDLGATPKVSRLAAFSTLVDHKVELTTTTQRTRLRAHKVRGTTTLISMLLIVLAAGSLMSILGPGFGLTAQSYEVTYRVTTDTPPDAADDVLVTYFDERGRRIEQPLNLTGAMWVFSMRSGRAASVTIQEQGHSTVTCEILVNGVVWRSNQVSGENPVAECGGRVGQE